jgi:hypothetical protein
MPCKILERKVFHNDTVINYLNRKAIVESIDAEKDMGIPLSMKYGVTEYPTLLIFNPSGVLVCDKVGIDGISSAALFIDFMTDVFNGINILPARGFSSQLPSMHSYPDFYQQYFINKKQPDSVEVINYLKNQSDLFSEKNWDIIKVFGNNSMQNFVVSNANKYIDLYGYTVKSMVQEKIHNSLNNDFRTKDSFHFKRDLEAFIKLERPILGKQAIHRRYLIELNFWAKTGLDWHHFLTSWENYRKLYGTDLDVKAAKYINDYCPQNTLRRLAENILLYDLKQNPHEWKIMVGLANLLNKDESLKIENSNQEYPLPFYAYSRHKITLNPDSLYEQAIKEAKGNEVTISLIVGRRLNSGLYNPDEEKWKETMKYFEKYMPKAYIQFHNSEMLTYYKNQHKWSSFVKYANRFFKQRFIKSNMNSGQNDEINAHDVYYYADAIYMYSSEIGQIDTAIHWMSYLSKNYPQNVIYENEKNKLKKKLKYLSGKK